MTATIVETPVYGQDWRPGWNDYCAVSIQTFRAIFKCKNKNCKHVWAREYKKCYKDMGGTVGEGYLLRYTSPRYDLNRIDEHGKEVDLGHDYGCPKCGGHNTTGDIIKGVETEKKCDARCTGAKGHDCECSCGGNNHGIDHLV